VPSIHRTPNQRWRARYRDPSGRSRSRTFDRKIDATRFLERVGVDVQRGEWTDPALRRTTLGRWAEEWFDTTAPLKPSTRRGYRAILNRRILPYWGERPIGSIDRADVRRWVAELTGDGLSPKWVRNVASVLALVLELAQDAGAIRDNPARRLRLPRSGRPEARFLTAEEVSRLADATREEYRFFVVLAAYTGLRPGELCGLRVKRLNLLRRRVHVAETLQPIGGELVSGPPKTYEVRSVPLPRFVAAQAEAHLTARTAQLERSLVPDDWVFGGQNDPAAGLNRDSFRKWVMLPALRAAGLPEAVRTHDLRHTCASLLIQLGAHPKAIQERLGHSDISVTLNLYGHLFPSLEEHLTESLEALWRSAGGR
jgi:integrase